MTFDKETQKYIDQHKLIYDYDSDTEDKFIETLNSIQNGTYIMTETITDTRSIGEIVDAKLRDKSSKVERQDEELEEDYDNIKRKSACEFYKNCSLYDSKSKALARTSCKYNVSADVLESWLNEDIA